MRKVINEVAKGEIMSTAERGKLQSNCALNLQYSSINAKVSTRTCLLDVHIQGATLFPLLDILIFGYGKKHFGLSAVGHACASQELSSSVMYL